MLASADEEVCDGFYLRGQGVRHALFTLLHDDRNGRRKDTLVCRYQLLLLGCLLSVGFGGFRHKFRFLFGNKFRVIQSKVKLAAQHHF